MEITEGTKKGIDIIPEQVGLYVKMHGKGANPGKALRELEMLIKDGQQLAKFIMPLFSTTQYLEINL